MTSCKSPLSDDSRNGNMYLFPSRFEDFHVFNTPFMHNFKAVVYCFNETGTTWCYID